MIIRKKTAKKNQNVSAASSEVNVKKNIIKKEDVNLNAKILDTKNVEDTNSPQNPDLKNNSRLNSSQAIEDSFEKIDISSIDFKQRVERRRGDRRRGYRRIDERSLVSRAQQEAHTIKELAAKEGYQNGIAKAQDEIEKIKKSLIEFLSLKDNMYDEFYPHIMELALEIAQKIIKQEVMTSPEILKNVLDGALDELNSETQKITVKVHPDDLDFAQASLPDIIEAKDKGIKFNFQGDETIEQGSCTVIANNGVIDADFKTQLAILQSAFGIYKGGF